MQQESQSVLLAILDFGSLRVRYRGRWMICYPGYKLDNAQIYHQKAEQSPADWRSRYAGEEANISKNIKFWHTHHMTKLICFIDSSPKPDLYDSLGSSIICFLKRFVSYQNLKKQGFEFKAESMRTNVHVLAAFKLSIDIGDTPRIVKLSVLVLAWYSRLTLVTFK
jgi:hypothetical protein